jgi:hypothetical protein
MQKGVIADHQRRAPITQPAPILVRSPMAAPSPITACASNGRTGSNTRVIGDDSRRCVPGTIGIGGCKSRATLA